MVCVNTDIDPFKALGVVGLAAGVLGVYGAVKWLPGKDNAVAKTALTVLSGVAITVGAGSLIVHSIFADCRILN